MVFAPAGTPLIERRLAMKQYRKKVISYLTITLCLVIALPCAKAAAEEEAKITLLIVNPSDKKPMKSPVSYYLPPEIVPQDVIDNAEMEILYDEEKESYYLQGDFELEPKETKKLTVVVRNVWRITDEDIAETQKLLSEKAAALQNTKFHDAALALKQKVTEQLDRIMGEQKKSDEEKAGIKKQIELFRAHHMQLKKISQDIISLDTLKRMGPGAEAAGPTIKFLIKAANPSSESKAMTVSAVLPQEITTEDVLDKGNFDLTFRRGVEAFALEMKDQFEAKEEKQYTVVIKNIWFIPPLEVELLRKQTEQLMGFFTGTQFEDYAKQNMGIIYNNLDAILKSQEEIAGSTSIKDHRRTHTLNKQRLVTANKKIRELQDLMLELPMESKKEDEDIEDIIKKLAEVKDKVLMALGYQPDKPITWVIIFGICIFLAVFAIAFYVAWLGKLNKNKFQAAPEKAKKGPAGAGKEPPAPAEGAENVQKAS